MLASFQSKPAETENNIAKKNYMYVYYSMETGDRSRCEPETLCIQTRGAPSIRRGAQRQDLRAYSVA